MDNNQENQSQANSPSSNGSTTQTPPLTPKPTSRSDPNPYPTTFIQADSSSFKQVVQMLTGSSSKQPDPTPSKVSSSSIPMKKQSFKLYERRNSLNLKNGLMINPMAPRYGSSGHHAISSPRVQDLLSPSILDFPALALSPVTPLEKMEEKVISEKGFYLHPSPRHATDAEPRLLPLFPLTSPKVVTKLK